MTPSPENYEEGDPPKIVAKIAIKPPRRKRNRPTALNLGACSNAAPPKREALLRPPAPQDPARRTLAKLKVSINFAEAPKGRWQGPFARSGQKA